MSIAPADSIFCLPHAFNKSFWNLPVTRIDDITPRNATYPICCELSDDPHSTPECFWWLLSSQYICTSSPNCITQCQQPAFVYLNWFTFTYCLGLPNLLEFHAQNLLGPNWTEPLSSSLVHNTSDVHVQIASTTQGELKGVTSALTDCLISSCRGSELCSSTCSAANLLVNSTSPSFKGISSCLDSLCPQYQGLPGGNSDITGIGVFSSYILQCVIATLAWIFIIIFQLWDQFMVPRYSRLRSSRRHQLILIDGLEEFHKTQVFFSSSLSIALLVTGVFKARVFGALALLPLAMNGSTPLIATLLLITHYRKCSTFLLSTTILSWFLASICFWSLYQQTEDFKMLLNQALNPNGWFTTGALPSSYFDMSSSNLSCGPAGIMAICQLSVQTWRQILETDVTLRLSAVVWAINTLSLLYAIRASLLGSQHGWISSKLGPRLEHVSQILEQWDNYIISKINGSSHMGRFLLVLYSRLKHLATSYKDPTGKLNGFFLGCAGVSLICISSQFLFFDTSIQLHLVKGGGWSFGQIVAVTIWIPPILEYLHILIIKRSPDSTTSVVFERSPSSPPKISIPVDEHSDSRSVLFSPIRLSLDSYGRQED